MGALPTINQLWKMKGFSPTAEQKKAIFHTNGPLFLTAGPGSGKTRVLLWRTLNLIVYQGVKAEEIYLSTFTEKAALQLKEGLWELLGMVSNATGVEYDLSKMALGTVHSICQRLLSDRRFSPAGNRMRPPAIYDELDQYFHIYDAAFWKKMTGVAGLADANLKINGYFNGYESNSRHRAVTNCISMFNRFSEECLDPSNVKPRNRVLKALLKMYAFYKDSLNSTLGGIVDLSLLQQAAYNVIAKSQNGGNIFRHVIVDEYQDTNTIQEKIFFALAKMHRNICVVGDDDQALYRFRGATVENLVEFPKRCYKYLKVKPKRIDLVRNFRSRERIVSFYSDFIEKTDWRKGKTAKAGYHRISDKKIKAHSNDKGPSVVVTNHAKAVDVYAEIAAKVKNLRKTGNIQDYNQVAALFPSIRSASRPKGLKKAFEEAGIPVYAPRAGVFLEVDEAVALYGILLKIFGRPDSELHGSDGKKYGNWLDACEEKGRELCSKDRSLALYVKDRQADIAGAIDDYHKLMKKLKGKGVYESEPYNRSVAAVFANTRGISKNAIRSLSNKKFLKYCDIRNEQNNALSIKYAISRATALDWTVLDLFYQLGGFTNFRHMYELAETGKDEGPICNLGLISQHLARFMDEHGVIITGAFLDKGVFSRTFFSSYIYALYRLAETEYEDNDVPFPKGRVSFLTIHQAKGLEFPVVILGSVYKQKRGAPLLERTVRELMNKKGEPLDRLDEFDIMRMFYVSLSRAENLLILPRYTHNKSASEPFNEMLHDGTLSELGDLDIKKLPAAGKKKPDQGKVYSYTGDYLMYKKCPRNYMFFRKYGFVPSRSQTMFFGSLVHKTIEDLHNLLISQKANGATA